MLTRRRFLSYSAAGMLAASTGCHPHLTAFQPDRPDLSADAHQWLADKAGFAKHKNRLLGYPVNMNTPPDAFFAWRRQMQTAGIDVFAYNNVGDPFDTKTAPIPFNTHDFERELILRFGRLWQFPAHDIWGFLSNSGTDSNMHGMYMGRTLLTSRTGQLPKAYFTQEAHYSIQILRDLLGLETVLVGTLPDGGMDPEDLRTKLAANRSQPALVVATIGTTFKGAIDHVEDIRQALQGYPSYLHLDAALFGGYLPHTSRADEVFQQLESASADARYDSICVSCHKFFGFPAPAGLFVTTQSRFDEFKPLFSRIHNPEYIHQVPGTITCSRDGVKPAEFYFFSTPESLAKQAQDTHALLRNTTYLMTQLQTHFPQLEPVRANAVSNTVYFLKPSDAIVEKYSLASMHLKTKRQKRNYAHVVVMPHADRQILDEFLSDLEHDSPTPA